MVTARTESIDKVLGLGLGADDYISKPFDPAELVELVGMCSPQQVNIGRNSRYDITLPEPTANEVKMLKAELEKFTKVEVKANAYRWMR